MLRSVHSRKHSKPIDEEGYWLQKAMWVKCIFYCCSIIKLLDLTIYSPLLPELIFREYLQILCHFKQLLLGQALTLPNHFVLWLFCFPGKIDVICFTCIPYVQKWAFGYLDFLFPFQKYNPLAELCTFTHCPLVYIWCLPFLLESV